MRRTFYIISILLFSFFQNSFAQSYEKMWKTLTEYQKKDLPKSAIGQAYSIFHKAQEEKNTAQMAKSFLTAMQYREDISPDSMNTDLASLKKMAVEAANAEDKALLYTILARVISRTDPKMALEYIKTAMVDASKLSKLTDDIYKPIIDKGNVSQAYFRNNLLHLLANVNLKTIERINDSSSKEKRVLDDKVIDINSFQNARITPTAKTEYTSGYLAIYQTLLREYKRMNMVDAWIITASDVANILPEYSKSKDESIAYENLEKLIDEYKDKESVAYAYNLLVERRSNAEEYIKAMDLIKECVRKYPKYIGIKYFKNKEKEIKHEEMSTSIRNAFAKVENDINIRYRNISAIKVNIYSLKADIPKFNQYTDQKQEDLVKKSGTLMKSVKHELPNYGDYRYHDKKIDFKIDNPGIYYIEMETEGGLKCWESIHITSFKPLIQTMPNKWIKIVVLDALNGKPVENASFNIYTNTSEYGKYRLTKSIKSNAQGEVYVDRDERIDRYNITNDYDEAMEPENFYSNVNRHFTDYKKEKVTLFTDRSIYKPSQTVHFSGIAYTQNDDSTKVIKLKEYEASLLDANSRVVSTMNVTTDKFGAFSGSFVIPTGTINGNFCIKVISCNTSFQVEEYKRPSFQVEFKPIERSFAVGDTVYVDGCAKTFTGLPVKDASVRYKIKTGTFGFLKNSGSIVVDDTIKTNENGCFTIPVVIDAIENGTMRCWYNRYEVTATATDNSGESVEATTSIPFGTSSLIIDADGIGERVLRENNDSIVCRVTNLLDRDIETPVALKLYRIENDGKDSVLVMENDVMSNVRIPMEWANNLKSAKYRIVLRCNDDKGKEAEYTKSFILFSLNDKRPPVISDFWIYNDDNRDRLSFGTSKKDVDIYFNILGKDKVIESSVFNVTDSIININIAYKKEYGDGVEISLSFVKDGMMYTYNKEIVKPSPSKRLILKWETFRDNLQPGKNEEWRLRITYPDGKPANAQLMSTMYDASLDDIYRHGWHFNVNFSRDINLHPYSSFYGNSASFYIYDENMNFESPEFKYSSLSLPYLDSNMFLKGDLSIMYNSANIKRSLPTTKLMSRVQMAETGMMPDVKDTNVEVRKDFAETAFFYPQLNTDKNGVVRIAFSLPESLTKWHFIGIAHTEDVDFGMIESDITVSKDFMVKPSLPRFLRAGDRCIIPVSVTNLKDKDLSGDLSIEMIDAKSNKTLYSATRRADVDKGETKTYQFEYDVPQDCSLLICRIVGKGKKFSDGEQNYIPVLSDKEMITESVPMIMTDKGKYSYNIPASKDKNITLEVTANPIWHVVQSLPVMLSPRDDSAYSWATCLYATMVNEYLLEKNPAIHQFSSLYKSAPEAAPKSMIESELEKNQELKEIFLSETPWVMQGDNEEKQRKMLSQLSDMNYVKYNKQLAADHLLSLQNSDGSWSWYAKMPGNINITSDILESLARAKNMTDATFTPEMSRMYILAFNYLNDEARKSYQQALKLDKKNQAEQLVPLWIMKYIYVSTISADLKADNKVVNYYVDKLRNISPSLDIYQKSLCAVIFNKLSMKQDADAFTQSLIEYTLYTKEMGRYFDTKKARCTYSSNIIPSVVSTIEALQCSGAHHDYVEQMKQWLITMKGVQSWSTNTAITNAIYALLNSDKLSTDIAGDGYLKINAGRESFKISQNEPLGYIKKGISNNISSVSIEKTYPGLSYGAVYLQGLTKVDTLRQSSTGLMVKKILYKNGNRVDENTVLNVGDVVNVKLIVSSPMYMDFVQIKDPLYSCMQPCEQLSSVKWDNGLVYDKQIRNASINFFIDKLSKGQHTIEYDVYITKRGAFKSGLTIVESAYQAMFRSISSAIPLNVE